MSQEDKNGKNENQEKKLTKQQFQVKVADLCDSFEETYGELWEFLKLGSEKNLLQFEAFMIEVVILFANKTAKANRQYGISQERAFAKKRDACLVILGLLKGYYYKDEGSSGEKYTLLENRRENYLSNSDYTKLGSDEDKAISNFYTTTSRCIEDISKFLYEKKYNWQKVLKDAINKHIVDNEIKLPEPIYILDRAGNASIDDTEQPNNKTQAERPAQNGDDLEKQTTKYSVSNDDTNKNGYPESKRDKELDKYDNMKEGVYSPLSLSPVLPERSGIIVKFLLVIKRYPVVVGVIMAVCILSIGIGISNTLKHKDEIETLKSIFETINNINATGKNSYSKTENDSYTIKDPQTGKTYEVNFSRTSTTEIKEINSPLN